MLILKLEPVPISQASLRRLTRVVVTNQKSNCSSIGAVALRTRRAPTKSFKGAEKASPTVGDFTDIKHYAITLRGCHATMWVVLPDLDTLGEWRGCTVCRLFNQTLTTQYGAERLAKWINEIHNWGLGPCLDNFLHDIKWVIAGNNESSGAVSLGPEDVQ